MSALLQLRQTTRRAQRREPLRSDQRQARVATQVFRESVQIYNGWIICPFINSYINERLQHFRNEPAELQWCVVGSQANTILTHLRNRRVG